MAVSSDISCYRNSEYQIVFFAFLYIIHFRQDVLETLIFTDKTQLYFPKGVKNYDKF